MILQKGICAAAFCLSIVTAASAQLRVATWNVTNYDGSNRAADFATALYGSFQSRQFAPDVLVGQEFLSQAAVNAYLAVLNTAAGSPGDWSAAPFSNGADTDNAFFYRTSKVQYLGMTIVAVGSSATTNQPRNTNRYDVRPVGYAHPSTTMALIVSHMKAGTTQTDLDRRLVEAVRIRDHCETLPTGYQFMVMGDFNIRSAAESAYVELVGSQVNNGGRCFDPLMRSAAWSSATYQFLHTQDPSGAGGMDDRYDQILLSAGLRDGLSTDYIGSPTIPASLTTWNDPNHSYRCWGNDGTSYNQSLKVVGNTMVGPTIAQALINAADAAGHLPVYLDMKMPAKANVPAIIDFGKVKQGAVVSRPLNVAHGGDIAKWTAAGLQNLNYSISYPARFSGPAGPFVATPGGSNAHQISVDTREAGFKTGILLVNSNDPDVPVKAVTVQAYVVPDRRHGNFP